MAKAATSILPIAPRDMQHEIERDGFVWLDIRYPNDEQIDYLQHRFHFHQLHLDDVRSHLQRPKIDDADDQHYIFLVLHFPFYDKIHRVSTISEIEVFVGRDYLVMTHDGKLRALQRIVRAATDLDSEREQLMARGSGYLLYRIVEVLINACNPMIYRIYQKLDKLDAEMFRTNTQQTVQDLSFMRRDIISLRRIIKPNIAVLDELAKSDHDYLRLDEDAYFGDLVDGLTKIWDMLEEQKELIEGLDSTLFSLTSFRLNQEMKTFTIITVIFLPMTLIASILGMNVGLPGQENPFAFAISIVLMLVVAGAMMLFLRLRGWL